MVENALAMKMDPTVDVAPTPEFNDAAQAMVMDAPQAQMANNVNTAPNLGANFQMATTLDVAAPEAIQDYGPQTVEVTVNPELMQGFENASYALQTAQLASGSWLTDSLNMACDAASKAMITNPEVEVNPVVKVAQVEEVQSTWTQPTLTPGMNGMA